MSPNFSLRSLLFVTTAVAVIIGTKLFIIELTRSPRIDDRYYEFIWNLQTWGDVPVLVIWSVAIEWVLRRTDRQTPGRALLVSALALSLVWTLVGHSVIYQSLKYLWQGDAYLVAINMMVLINYVLSTIVWILTLAAFVRLYGATERHSES